MIENNSCSAAVENSSMKGKVLQLYQKMGREILVPEQKAIGDQQSKWQTNSFLLQHSGYLGIKFQKRKIIHFNKQMLK